MRPWDPDLGQIEDQIGSVCSGAGDHAVALASSSAALWPMPAEEFMQDFLRKLRPAIPGSSENTTFCLWICFR
jgi:hypothetical protein